MIETKTAQTTAETLAGFMDGLQSDPAAQMQAERDPFWEMMTPEDIRRALGTETNVTVIKHKFPIP